VREYRSEFSAKRLHGVPQGSDHPGLVGVLAVVNVVPAAGLPRRLAAPRNDGFFAVVATGSEKPVTVITRGWISRLLGIGARHHWRAPFGRHPSVGVAVVFLPIGRTQGSSTTLTPPDTQKPRAAVVSS
jgi:hypothetical protein